MTAIAENKYNKVIIALSIILPLAVAALFVVKIEGYDFSFLPPIYATINGITAVTLILAVMAIKKGNRKRHALLMQACIAMSALFLILYVAYHMTSGRTNYGGEGILKWVYYFILLTHILLSIVIIPLVLFTYVRALAERFDKHKKLARITFPIWLYVATTGVVVYLMISPFYS